ncbi:hypothetical protein EZJ19_05295 [Parasulfuritortus cantonensis]|uniref:Uncharacterized protein n=1 Tax=Parasulfuritortus cantonensis TaxID=2528202 RepID=A0A4R1BGJ8_9PROT|nr:hypothetical protein [Parasulfuritortus cantonensis]TCJ16319.1 hypothetical protein EZJ19_05295 [Parasulfuritortus cantonensis]
MLTSLLNAVGGLLGSVVDLLGGILGSLTRALAPASTTDLVATVASTDTASASATEQIDTAIDATSSAATDLLDTAIDGTDQLLETGLVDSAHALGDLAEDLADLTITTITTNYREDGTVSSVVEEVSHAPGALVMMQYVSEVLAPQVDGIGDGVSQFMQETGTGVETALGNLTAYDLSYSTTIFGTSQLVIERT